MTPDDQKLLEKVANTTEEIKTILGGDWKTGGKTGIIQVVSQISNDLYAPQKGVIPRLTAAETAITDAKNQHTTEQAEKRGVSWVVTAVIAFFSFALTLAATFFSGGCNRH
jgi:hypothetical protein